MYVYRQTLLALLIGIISGFLVYGAWLSWSPLIITALFSPLLLTLGAIFGIVTALYWTLEFGLQIRKYLIWIVLSSLSFCLAYYSAFITASELDGSKISNGEMLIFGVSGLVGMAILVIGFCAAFYRLNARLVVLLLFGGAVVAGLASLFFNIIDDPKSAYILFVPWQAAAAVIFTFLLKARGARQ